MKKTLFFIAGSLFGAGIALVAAPKSGSETRALIADKVSAYRGGVIPPEAVVAEEGADGAVEGFQAQSAAPVQSYFASVAAKAQDAVAVVQEKVQDAAGSVQAKVQDSMPGANKNDELREKIEAARQRIAAQVVKNAEESAQAAAAVEAEAVAEPVQDASADQEQE